MVFKLAAKKKKCTELLLIQTNDAQVNGRVTSAFRPGKLPRHLLEHELSAGLSGQCAGLRTCWRIPGATGT